MQSSMETDSERCLIAGLRAGDDTAYEVLVQKYTRRLFQVAHRILDDRADAQDCLQEAFLQVFLHIETFQARAALSTWLYRIVTNAALMKLRTRARRKEESLEILFPLRMDSGEQACVALSPEAIHVRHERARLVWQAVGQLPRTYRTTFILRELEDHTTQQTAAALGASPNAVKIRVHRARTALKETLGSLRHALS